jgi:hypothetical protein
LALPDSHAPYSAPTCRDELQAGGSIGARQGHQVLHRRVGHELAPAHALLDLLRQLGDEREAATDPARALVEATRQLLLRQTESLPELAQQPCLLERVIAAGRAHQPLEHQCLGLTELPARHEHRVGLQLPERAQPLVPVHHDRSAAFATDHHDRRLLAVLRQRRQQALLLLWRTATQRLVAKLELVKLELHRPPPAEVHLREPPRALGLGVHGHVVSRG